MTRRQMATSATGPLLWGVRVCIALVLLLPFVVTPGTYFPFVVGKALYARTVIEVLVCLWTALMLLQPSFRPPRSTVLLLLAAGLAAHVLATILGVSPTRSVWSTYERMQGLVDAAHWFAFALVLVSVLRDAAGVRALLNANLGVALVLGCLAVVGYFLEEVPFYGAPERDAPRIGSVFGNATYLGAYATTNFLVAVGFLASSLLGAKRQSGIGAPDSRRPARQASPAADRSKETLWLARGFWAAAALANLVAVVLSGSFTALGALAGGLVFLFVGTVLLVRSRALRLLALGIGVFGGIGATAVGVAFFIPNAFPALTEATREQPLLQGIAGSHVRHPSFAKRRLAWSAGLRGFAERPMFGWGPENYVVVFGRYAMGIGHGTEVHDYAHNKIIEEAATKGLPGLACYLALWLFAIYVVCRAAKHGPPDDRVLALFVGAALASYFVQQQALLDSLTLSMQLMILLAFAASLETPRGEQAKRLGWAAKFSGIAVSPTLRRVGIGVAACALVGLSIGGMATSKAIYRATTNLQGSGAVRATRERPLAHIEQAVADFKPMANPSRTRLFLVLHTSWPAYRYRGLAEARRLLARAQEEGAHAVAVEPENWLIHASLAKLYCVAGRTEPGYLALAIKERERTRALAPNLDSFLPANLIVHDRCRAKSEEHLLPPEQ